MKMLLTIIGVLQVCCAAGQIEQVKHVTANGGSIRQGPTYLSISVAGQAAIGRFSENALSGTIGYLDDDDFGATRIKGAGLAQSEVFVFPNPNKGSFTVQIKSQRNAEVKMSLIDCTGRVSQQRQESMLAGKNSYSFSSIPNGVWMIRIEMDGSMIEKKVVVL